MLLLALEEPMAVPVPRPEEVLDDLVDFYKALSDRTRLRLVGLLAERPRYVQELAGLLGVSAPTVSHHLFRLRAAGLVAAGPRENQVYYRLEKDRIERLSRALSQRSSSPPADDRERVLRAFFDGGRLRQMPTVRHKKKVVLEEVARHFTPGRRYSEREVDAMLKRVYHDHCEMRRALVDFRLLQRERGIYERVITPES